MDKRIKYFIEIIREICEENNIKLNIYSNYWVLELIKDKKKQYILGYNFEINTSASSMLCNDKVGTSLVLSKYKISNVKHELIMSPLFNPRFLITEDQYEKAKRFLWKNKKVVVKPNNGSSGKDVYCLDNEEKLEECLDRLLSLYRNVAISKYEDIIQEYRLVIVGDKLKLIYRKEIPSVIGDGVKTVQELAPYLKVENENYIPSKDEVYKINWKHNLALGAIPVVETNKKLISKLLKIAKETCMVLNINAASVDIIETSKGFKVLEVNNGIMMGNYAAIAKENYAKTKVIYHEIIDIVFKNKN